MGRFTKAITVESIASKSSRSTGASSAATPRSQVPDSRIRRVKTSECKAAGACLADAFSDDDVAAYFFNCPDTASWSKERKWALHVNILEVMVYMHLKCGLVLAIGDPKKNGTFDAVALWLPPGMDMGGWSVIRHASIWPYVARMVWRLSQEGRARLMHEFAPLLHETKLEVLQDRDPDSWYLVYLGTHHRARGKGLATKLVSEVTRQADQEHRACYLESSNAANVPLYRKLGFEVMKKIYLSRAHVKVSLDIMVREPAATGSTMSGAAHIPQR